MNRGRGARRSGAGGPVARGPRLILLGVSVRALAASVIASRLRARRFPGGVLALDYFGDADLGLRPGPARCQVLSLRRDFGVRRDVPSLLAAALRLPWDACVYAGGLENRPEAIARLQDAGHVLGNNAGVVRAVRDPGRLYAVLREAGLPHPRTLLMGSVRAPRSGRWIWKGRRSGAGMRVGAAPPGSPRPRGHYLQEFVPGLPASVVFIADGREARLLGGSLMLTGFEELGGRGFLYGGSIAGPIDVWLPRGARRVLEAAASVLARRFGLRGINGIDFVLHDGVPHLLEVNPRYTASTELLEERAGRSFFDLHLEALEGRLPVAPEETRRGAPPFLGKGIFYADRPVRGGDPRLLAAIGCRDIPAPGEAIEAGEPVCTLVAAGSTPADCRGRLISLASRVRAILASGHPPREATRRVSREAPVADAAKHPAALPAPPPVVRSRHNKRVPSGSRRISVRLAARGA